MKKDALMIITLLVGLSGFFAYEGFKGESSSNNNSTQTQKLSSGNENRIVAVTDGSVEFWPPRLDEKFPNITLKTSGGDSVSLNETLERMNISVALIEPIGMTCPGCAAFVGAHKKGVFRGVNPQQGLGSIEEYFSEYTGHSISDQRVALVHLLLYSSTMRNPSQQDAIEWANHFKPSASNYIVIAAQSEYQNPESYKMIPGFFLLDQKLHLRKDSTGHNPRHNLYTELLPLAAQLINEKPLHIGLRSDSLTESLGLSVSSAYQAIPHRQVSFNQNNSTQMTDTEKKFFDVYFQMVANAVVARVALLLAYDSGNMSQSSEQIYEKLISDAQSLEAGSLENYKKDLISVLEEHRDFFEDWKSGRKPSSTRELGRSPKVQSSSARLKKVYSNLMSNYSNETPENKDAFFQHLCALDFI